MDGMLVVDDVVKTFRGKTAVDHASFKVKEGSFTALLGPNGSGKSTTLKMCTNLFQPDSGRILIGGVDVREDTVSALSGAGCVIETPEIYPDVTGRRYLEYLAKVAGMGKEVASAEAERVLGIVDMSDRADGKVRGYSKGMRQRVILAQALLGNPSLLILDEPTSGLDPQGSAEFGRILRELNGQGKTILMSSHMLHEVEGLCDSVVIINRGRAVAQGPLSDIVRRSRLTVSVVGGAGRRELDSVSGMPGVCEASLIEGGLSIRLDGGPETQADLVHDMVAAGIRVYSVRKEDPLEEAFMDITGGDSQ